MGVVDLAVVPTGRGSSPAEEPGSSLDIVGRADTEQGNRASAPANTADADSVEKPGQEDDADSPATRTVVEKHERDEDPGVLSSSATMAGAETSGQNGSQAYLPTPPQQRSPADSTTPTSHQPADGAAVRTPASATPSPAAVDQPLPACADGRGDGGAAPGGADGGADRHTLRLPPHHGGAAPQAGRGDAAHEPSRPCLPRAGAAGLRRARHSKTHCAAVGRR